MQINARPVTAGMIALLSAVTWSTCLATEQEDARAVMEANKAAIITVEIVTETTASYEGETEKSQSKTSATATIIDPGGLCVTALSATNPRDMFSDMMSSGDEGFSSSTRVVDAKYRLDDGSEIAADVVLRDRDLDLVFLKPKKAPQQPYKYVDLSQPSTPQVFDSVIHLGRLGQVGNRAIAGSIEPIAAVITKPRTLYYVKDGVVYSMGYPVFGMDGKPVGILALRNTVTKSDDMATSAMDKVLPVIIPSAAVASAAEQAKTAQPEKAEAAPPANSTPAKGK